MTDKELLELAAKAIGTELWYRDSLCWIDGVSQDRPLNPLEFDEDAFFFQVKLGLDVTVYSASKEVAAVKPSPRLADMKCPCKRGINMQLTQILTQHNCLKGVLWN